MYNGHDDVFTIILIKDEYYNTLMVINQISQMVTIPIKKMVF